MLRRCLRSMLLEREEWEKGKDDLQNLEAWQEEQRMSWPLAADSDPSIQDWNSLNKRHPLLYSSFLPKYGHPYLSTQLYIFRWVMLEAANVAFSPQAEISSRLQKNLYSLYSHDFTLQSTGPNGIHFSQFIRSHAGPVIRLVMLPLIKAKMQGEGSWSR